MTEDQILEAAAALLGAMDVEKVDPVKGHECGAWVCTVYIDPIKSEHFTLHSAMIPAFINLEQAIKEQDGGKTGYLACGVERNCQGGGYILTAWSCLSALRPIPYYKYKRVH